MFRIIFRLGFVLFLVLLTAAYFTNPTREDFARRVNDILSAEFRDRITDPTYSEIAEQGVNFVSGLAERMLDRDNYYVCSVFTLELPTGTYRYLGAYHQFIPLQQENPLELLENIP